MLTFSRSLLPATALAVAAGLAATTPPSTADSPHDGGATSRTVLDVRGLDLGEPPAVAWSERRSGRTVIHGTDGTTTPAPNRLSEIAPMGSGHVIQTYGAGGSRTRWIAADGTPGRREWRTGHGLAVSPLGRVVAFAGRAGKVWTIDHEGDRVLRFNPVPVTGTAHAVAVSGENCKEGEGDPGLGCSIAVNGPRRAFYTTSHGIVDSVPFLRQVSTGRGRWLGGITSLSDFGSCSALLRSSQVRWRTCDNQLSDISPDRRHVLGTPAYADGFGPTALAVLATSDGKPVHSFTSARDGRSATYFDEVWEDPEHVLVVTFQADRWAVVRLGVDGSMEYAVAPRRGSMDMSSPFQLQTR
ncbi:hypothetical protein GCM10011376_16770 [Nocardioides flavus (ex Wang et al. 2016)]|uniref:Uncharacterized protein n=1 Tax=Nocardioides flavus (ex Wang et al. 2016) TaxID=2058780 RepID=A0ABQ3HHF1_9ACTN|nr:hypothetical protein [Nocardioides flavus (ex Wang et al. 2016)]GHE17067.1 hypothetical protein GCM10011376_16770 [Nocardioides flavus (ex Wang et al. 2016)]